MNETYVMGSKRFCNTVSERLNARAKAAGFAPVTRVSYSGSNKWKVLASMPLALLPEVWSLFSQDELNIDW